MAAEKLLTISEFSRLSSIKRKNLIFYDEIGLFSPAHVGDNGYRYYTYRQLDTANLIWSLKEIGMPLAAIKDYTSRRTPENMLRLFRAQKEKVEEEIAKLKEIKTMMEVYIADTAQFKDVDTDAIDLREWEAAPIALGPVIDYSDGKSPVDATAQFYDYAAAAGFVCSYPLGAVVAREDAEKGDHRPMRYYYRTPNGADAMPAGLYAEGYGRGDYGHTGEVYARLFAYLKARDLVLCGDVYEEYLINEISTQEPEDYLFRVSMPVARRGEMK
ncbi:MerR family transcriptional regulator [Clostridia bacterium OttesenSCG-928-O13]|nr:MerR family transcriptional regulator [Clostridia bacterium OttesenSCG-928-O13]